MTKHSEIPIRTIRRAAAAADCDARTAMKVALGLPVRGIVRERVAEELHKLGIDVPGRETGTRS